MTQDIFNYGTPESVGYSSAQIEKIYRELQDTKFMNHGLLVAHNGTIMAEGYSMPYTKDTFHRMYSTSKSFVSTAIGCLIDDKKISLEDKIVKFFPEKVTEKTHRYILDMTIRDLLMMSTCFTCGNTYSPHRDDWVDSFFYTEPDHPSGTIFNYDTSGTFILDVIVEKVTGMRFLDFLKQRGLLSAGFSENAWCIKSPDGYSWGGSGVMCTLRDLARLGQIYLNKGKIGDHQMISEWYVNEATSRQIDNNSNGHLDCFHGHGYGYQIWCLPNDCFGFLGMGGQVVLASPKYNLLLAAISDEQGNSFGYSKLYDVFYRYLLLPAMEKESLDPLPEDKKAYSSLCEYTNNLTLPIPVLGMPHSKNEMLYSGKTYTLNKNKMGIDWLRLDIQGEEGTLVFFARNELKCIPFGLGQYKTHPFPETDYSSDQIRKPKGVGYRTISAGVWTQENTLAIRSYLIDDYFGNLHTILAFKGNEVTIQMQKTAEWFLEEYQGLAVGTYH